MGEGRFINPFSNPVGDKGVGKGGIVIVEVVVGGQAKVGGSVDVDEVVVEFFVEVGDELAFAVKQG